MGKSHVKSLSGSNLTPKSKEKSLLLFYFCANLNTNHCIAVHVFYVTVMYIAIGKNEWELLELKWCRKNC